MKITDIWDIDELYEMAKEPDDPKNDNTQVWESERMLRHSPYKEGERTFLCTGPLDDPGFLCIPTPTFPTLYYGQETVNWPAW